MLSSYLWLFQSFRNNQMRRPSHNMFEMDWGGCNYFARSCCIPRVINSILPEIHCATGFKWQRREFGWEARDRSQGWNSGKDSVKETTEVQKGGAGLLTWDGTVLHGCAREYKHDSYMMTGLARPMSEVGAIPMALQSTHSEEPAESSALWPSHITTGTSSVISDL